METTARTTSTAYGRPYRPLPLAFANRAGRLLERLGDRGACLGEESLVDAARRKTGLDDFGERSFLARLRLLLGSIEAEARLHPLGRFMARANCVRILASRLRIEEALRLHPEILDEEIEDPIVIAGLQRTGTTVVHRLLACDPSLRFLPSWEAINPAPPPRRGRGAKDTRIAQARFAKAGLKYMAPDFFAIHPIEACEPEEDVLLLEYALWSTVPEAIMRVPTFSSWLEEQDHVEAYRYFRKILQLLHWLGPKGRWLLKSPHHMEHLGALFAVFPGARVIQTHRDPLRVIPSFCSMVCHARGVFSDEVDPREVGSHWSRKASLMVGRSMEARGGGGGGRFIDIPYDGLVADPMGEIRRVYDFAGRPLAPPVERAMLDWIAGNPQHKHGRHRYRLEDFGLDKSGMEERFAPYCRMFGIGPGSGGTA